MAISPLIWPIHSRSASMANSSIRRSRRGNSPTSTRSSNKSNRCPDRCSRRDFQSANLPIFPLSLPSHGESWVPGGPRGLQNRCLGVMRRGVGSIPTLSAIFSFRNRPRNFFLRSSASVSLAFSAQNKITAQAGRSRYRNQPMNLSHLESLFQKGGDACVA